MASISKTRVTALGATDEEINYYNFIVDTARSLATILGMEVLATYTSSSDVLDVTYIDNRIPTYKELLYGVAVVGLPGSTYGIGITISESKIMNFFMTETPEINNSVMEKYTIAEKCNSLININARSYVIPINNNVSLSISTPEVSFTVYSDENYKCVKLESSATIFNYYPIIYDIRKKSVLFINSTYHTLWDLFEPYLDENPWLDQDTQEPLVAADPGNLNSYYSWSRKYNVVDLQRYSNEFTSDVKDFSMKTLTQWHLINFIGNTAVSIGQVKKTDIPIHNFFGLLPFIPNGSIFYRRLFAPLSTTESYIYRGINNGSNVSVNSIIHTDSKYFFTVFSDGNTTYAISMDTPELQVESD